MIVVSIFENILSYIRLHGSKALKEFQICLESNRQIILQQNKLNKDTGNNQFEITHETIDYDEKVIENNRESLERTIYDDELGDNDQQIEDDDENAKRSRKVRKLIFLEFYFYFN